MDHHGPAPSWADKSLLLKEQVIHTDVVVDFSLMHFTLNAWIWEEIRAWYSLFWARFGRLEPSEPPRHCQPCSGTMAISP